MKSTFYLILALSMVICLPSFGFNYTINFSGSGAFNSVDQVVVQNLSRGTSVIVPAGNVLNLTDIVSSVDLINEHKSGINIFPNPIQEKSIVRFKGDATKAAAVYAGYEPLKAEDIADTAWYVANLPKHVCINDIVMTCVAQGNSFTIHKDA